MVEAILLQTGGYVGAVVYVLGAVVYSLVSYFSKRTKPGGEEFDFRLFLRTVIVGVIVGAVAWQQGLVVDLGNFWQLASAIGAPALAERIVQIIYRLLREWGIISEEIDTRLYPKNR